MKVWENPPHYILEVPRSEAKAIDKLMAYRGLTFSTSASTSQKAILSSTNPYALADLADPETCPKLRAYRLAIDASRALDGKGTKKLPPGKELWGYQRGSLDYVLARGGGIIGDQPGLGKTPMGIAFCNHFEAQRILVIVPASVRIQWGERIKEWSTIPNVNVKVMLKTKDGIHPTAHYVVISYDAARNPAIIRAIARSKWDVLICDEAHKMKNMESLTTRAILGNRRGDYMHGDHKIKAISHYCDKHLALTGTPLLNRPSEAYTLLRHFDHEAIDFMGWEQFKDRFNRQAEIVHVGGRRHKLESTSLEIELQNRLRVNVMVRHEKKDVHTQMKPPRFSIVRVMENGAVRDALDAEGMLGLAVEEIQTTKDFQILGHIAEARRLMGEAMAPQIVEYAKDFLEGSDEKLVIFGWHINVLKILQDGLQKYGAVQINGRMSATARDKALDKFIRLDDVRVVVGNIQSMGTGLDGMQLVCSHCLLAEPDWVPSNNEQAVARLDRIGQKFQVSSDIFVAPGSISEKILVKALQKMNVIHRVLDEKGNSRV